MTTKNRPKRPTSRLQQRMRGDLELAGSSDKTQEAYVAAVRGLAKYHGRSPVRITEQQVRDYILFLKRERQLAIGTLRPIVYGIKFLYRNTVPRNWPLLNAIKLPTTRGLPTILDRDEVERLIGAARERCCRASTSW